MQFIEHQYTNGDKQPRFYAAGVRVSQAEYRQLSSQGNWQDSFYTKYRGNGHYVHYKSVR